VHAASTPVIGKRHSKHCSGDPGVNGDCPFSGDRSFPLPAKKLTDKQKHQ